jgi:hypothetical protein
MEHRLTGIWSEDPSGGLLACIMTNVAISKEHLYFHNKSGVEHRTGPVDLRPQDLFIQHLASDLNPYIKAPLSSLASKSDAKAPLSYLLVSLGSGRSFLLTQVDNLHERVAPLRKRTLFLPGTPLRQAEPEQSALTALVVGANNFVSEIAKKALSEILGMIHSL